MSPCKKKLLSLVLGFVLGSAATYGVIQVRESLYSQVIRVTGNVPDRLVVMNTATGTVAITRTQAFSMGKDENSQWHDDLLDSQVIALDSEGKPRTLKNVQKLILKFREHPLVLHLDLGLATGY